MSNAETARRDGAGDERWVVDLLLDYFELEGVEHIFGVPGGPLTTLFESLKRRRTIEFVLAKTEGGAAFMAASNARVRRSLSVCCVTSGPGATNALTGATGAMRDALPVFFLTGQVATKAFGKGAIQESTAFATDVVQMFQPTTKLSALVPTAHSADSMVRAALRAALTGRWGPVHLSLPADVARQPVRERAPRQRTHRAVAARPFDAVAVAAAARALVQAQRPCLYAGNGVALAGAEPELLRLAEKLGAPVITSPKGKGVFPEHHPLSLGVFGLGGHEAADAWLEEHDAMLVVGSSLGEFSSSAWDPRLAPANGPFLQCDVDAAEIGRNYPVDVALVGDAQATLAALNVEVSTLLAKPRTPPQKTTTTTTLETAPSTQALRPPELVRALRDAVPDDAMLFVDNGNSIMWAGHHWEARRPGTYFIDLGVASMGSAVAGVVGGQLGRRRTAAVALVGDAAFAMSGVEVHTAVELRLPIVWVVLNNAGHGMVAHGEALLVGADLGFGHFRQPLDVAAFARSLGARGVRASTVDEFRAAVSGALDEDGPTVIDAVVDASVAPPTLVRRASALARFFAPPEST